MLMTKMDLIQQLKQAPVTPKFIGFFYTKEVPNQVGAFVLSNFYRRDFVLPSFDGKPYTFSCVEQYMMYQKAIVFNDHATAREILSLKNVYPLKYKKLGRKVKGFNDRLWAKHAQAVVREAVLAKFSQNNDLKRYLLNTGNAILVEDSPYDKIWGIGVDDRDSRLTQPDKWPGRNQLGFILMDVRDELNAAN